MSLSVFNPIFMSFVAISSCLAYVAVPGPHCLSDFTLTGPL